MAKVNRFHVVTSEPRPPTTIAQRQQLSRLLWQWGMISEIKAGGVRIAIARYERIYGSHQRRAGFTNVSDAEAAHDQIERALEGYPPMLRGLLWFQYARPARLRVEDSPNQTEQRVRKSVNRSIDAYVETVFARPLRYGERHRPGEVALSTRDFDNLVSSIKKIRRQWSDRTIERFLA